MGTYCKGTVHKKGDKVLAGDGKNPFWLTVKYPPLSDLKVVRSPSYVLPIAPPLPEIWPTQLLLSVISTETRIRSLKYQIRGNIKTMMKFIPTLC